MTLIDVIHKVRPAPVQSALIELLGLNRRREAKFGPFTFFIDPSSDFGTGVRRGDYEADMVATLNRYLQPGSTFVDVGANEGFFSVLASRLVGSTGRVVGVEPQLRLLPVIQRNLELNGCANVGIENCVLGAAAEELQLHLAPATNTGSSSLFLNTRYKLATQKVQCWPLGEFLDRCGLDRVDLMKVDVEGAEYDIVMPAGEVLKSGRIRNIALEYHPAILRRRGLSMNDMHGLLTQCGYRLDDQTTANSVYEFVGAN
jgi:FkbM family methyltransferase